MRHKTVIIILLIFITLELYLRHSMPDFSIWRLLRPSNVPGLVNELRPDGRFEFEGIYYKIPPTLIEVSSQGLRDRLFQYKKEANTKRVAILGDSFVFGWGVENYQCFAKVLEKMLNGHNDGQNYEVLNFGVPGYNLEQMLRQLKTKVLQFNVDYIIIYSTSDDFEPPIKQSSNFLWLLFENLYIVRKPVLTFRNLQHNFTFNSQSYYSERVNMALSEFNSTIPILKKNNVKIVFVIGNQSPSDVCNLRLRDFLRSNSIPTFAMDNYVNFTRDLLIPGDGHPNSKGHYRIGCALSEILTEQGIKGSKKKSKSSYMNIDNVHIAEDLSKELLG